MRLAKQYNNVTSSIGLMSVALGVSAGLFSPVAVPAGSRSLLGQQNFMVNIQAPAGVKFTPGALGTLQPHSSSHQSLASPNAAALSSPMQQQGLAGRQQQQPQQQQQQLLAALVTAWQELVVMLHNMRLRGMYCLMPHLMGAREAGDADAAYVFKYVSC
jgi:hypothetical protein